jgi:hypothetical protein
MIAAVTVLIAGAAFLFDVRQFTARGQLTVAANDASTRERPESKKAHETHCRHPPTRVLAKDVPLTCFSIATSDQSSF